MQFCLSVCTISSVVRNLCVGWRGGTSSDGPKGRLRPKGLPFSGFQVYESSAGSRTRDTRWGAQSSSPLDGGGESGLPEKFFSALQFGPKIGGRPSEPLPWIHHWKGQGKLVEVYVSVGTSVILVCKEPKRSSEGLCGRERV